MFVSSPPWTKPESQFVGEARSKAVRIASSHLITSCATAAAIKVALIFAALAGAVSVRIIDLGLFRQMLTRKPA